MATRTFAGRSRGAFLANRCRTHNHRELHKPDHSAAMLAHAIKHKPGTQPGSSRCWRPGNNRTLSPSSISKRNSSLTAIITNHTQLDEISKYLSYILRHEPHSIGLQLDTESWADIDSLIACASKPGCLIDKAMIQAVVASNKKK
jgi:hypothetical protein